MTHSGIIKKYSPVTGSTCRGLELPPEFFLISQYIKPFSVFYIAKKFLDPLGNSFAF